MSIWDTLFGGGEQQSTSVPKDITPEEFQGLRGGLAEWLKQALGGGGTLPQMQPPTNLIAQPSSQFHNLVSQAGSAASGSPLLDSAGSALQRVLGGGGQNPYLSQMIEAATRPLTRAFNETIVPNLLSRFTGGGHQIQGEGSSAFATEARKAGTDLLTSIGDVTSTLSGQAFENQANRELAAVGQAVGVSSEEMNRLNAGLEASLLPQLIEDQGVTRGLQLYDTQVKALLAVLQIAGQLTQATPAQQTSGSMSQSSGIIPVLFG